MADKISAPDLIVGRFRARSGARISEGYTYIRSAPELLASENLGACVASTHGFGFDTSTREFLWVKASAVPKIQRDQRGFTGRDAAKVPVARHSERRDES